MRDRIGLAVLCVVTAVGRAAEPSETITVTASATVYVKPDGARIHYAARASEPTMEAAREAAFKQAAAVADAAKDLKLADLTTTTGAVSHSTRAGSRARAGFGGGPVNPGANPAPPPGPVISYSAHVPLTTSIAEKDPDRLPSSLDTFLKKVVEAGAYLTAEGLDSDSPFGPGGAGRASSADSLRIDWLLTDDTAPRKDAFRAAVRKAKANAEAISKEIGWETLKVISVVDGDSAPRDVAERAVAAPRTPAGQVAVTARVTLKCSR
jgi:uncharacterized protein YggE